MAKTEYVILEEVELAVGGEDDPVVIGWVAIGGPVEANGAPAARRRGAREIGRDATLVAVPTRSWQPRETSAPAVCPHCGGDLSEPVEEPEDEEPESGPEADEEPAEEPAATLDQTLPPPEEEPAAEPPATEPDDDAEIRAAVESGELPPEALHKGRDKPAGARY